ncbi:hypothetical protein FH972_016472 [Carpinus fangiana]|uniref:Disease resistance N-terminal domain-containing protein n=1 Tax=Carpinus fangiana TaxID=176857 RepID=A0A5N6RG01_9ROSI|nr:hypothetical protein FH972_016472 [Carpinus fangiana]
MAELAYAIAENILEKLGSLAYREISLVLGIKSELKEFEGTMTTIKAVLLDAEEKQATNRPLRIWLRQLKDIFSDAEDVLDEVEYEVLKKQVVTTYGRTSRERLPPVTNYFERLSSIPSEAAMGRSRSGGDA